MQKRRIGDFFCTIVLWLIIGALVQWLMQAHLGGAPASGMESAISEASPGGGEAVNNESSGAGVTSYWNALVIVSLFFGVLAFFARDLMHDNPLTRLLRVIGTRLLGTTFDIGLFALGGTLFLLWGPYASATPEWQSLFIGVSLSLFIVILVVLGVIQALLKYTRMALVSIPALEFRPLVRVGLYLGLLVLIALVAWLAV